MSTQKYQLVFTDLSNRQKYDFVVVYEEFAPHCYHQIQCEGQLKNLIWSNPSFDSCFIEGALCEESQFFVAVTNWDLFGFAGYETLSDVLECVADDEIKTLYCVSCELVSVDGVEV